MAETSRDLFASRLGMLAATLGSSVGLGNIWKFPALTGEHGGASFLLVYILSTLVVGLRCMMRGTAHRPLDALQCVSGFQDTVLEPVLVDYRRVGHRRLR